ncbi:MAG: nicotinate-nucleotide adenylyltransferase [Synergistaceae bacterium]|jgi:nicotinate-nucleotide adenylyltransferase|nr:nicotinate-nucleotide adenylyltransferase [Synergistaceae bacterium]
MTDSEADSRPRRRKIGVMGGTFDPIHYGHLFAAEKARHALSLDRVIFVPAGAPPHKRYDVMAPAEDRYAMTLLAVNDNEAFDVSRIEIDRGGRSYTADTLEEMERIYADADFFFIVGVDTALDIPNWYRPDKIFSLCTVVAVARPGFLRDKIVELTPETRESLVVVDSTLMDVSATEIRNRVRDGLSANHLTPEAVCEYMRKKRLYSNMGES